MGIFRYMAMERAMKMKKRVYLPESEREWPDSKIAAKYGISRPTAWRAKVRGWFVPGYHERKAPQVDLSKLDFDKMRKIARSVYRRVILPLRYSVVTDRAKMGRFGGKPLYEQSFTAKYRAKYPYIRTKEDIEDLFQEAYLAMIERSGDEIKGDFWDYMWGIARIAMLHYARSGKTGATGA